MYQNKTVILANGSFPKSKKLLNILDHSNSIICCDGAVNNLIKSGREPSIIIGDLDSISPKIKKQFSEKLIHITDQNTNDLTKAVDWCVSQSKNDVLILGATGKREDHTIANIALLSKYNEQLEIRMLTENGIFIPVSKTTKFDSFVGQQVSIFSQNSTTKISSEGLKYPLDELELSFWWMGTLNECISKDFTLTFDDSNKIIVYLLNK